MNPDLKIIQELVNIGVKRGAWDINEVALLIQSLTNITKILIIDGVNPEKDEKGRNPTEKETSEEVSEKIS